MQSQNPDPDAARPTERGVRRTFDSERDGYFERDGERYVPTVHGAGPWAPGSISGRPVLGLCTHLFEEALPDESWLPARLTVDLVRMAMLEPTDVVVTARKAGRTALVVDIELLQNERVVALARGLATLAEATPDTEVWSTGEDLQPIPTDLLPAHPDYPMSLSAGRWVNESVTYEHGPFALMTPADGPGVGWARERGNLIVGEVSSPYVRLGLVADIGNPLINTGADGLKFINADVSLYLSRRPEGPYIGIKTLEHQHDRGTAVGAGLLVDEQGPVGMVAMTSTHQPHLPTIRFGDDNAPAATRRS